MTKEASSRAISNMLATTFSLSPIHFEGRSEEGRVAVPPSRTSPSPADRPQPPLASRTGEELQEPGGVHEGLLKRLLDAINPGDVALPHAQLLGDDRRAELGSFQTALVVLLPAAAAATAVLLHRPPHQ